jgi:hypothetical protein
MTAMLTGDDASSQAAPSPFTVLQCYPGGGGSAAKHWSRATDGTIYVTDAKPGKLFNVETKSIGTIRELHDVLQEVRGRRDCFIIRGTLRADLDPSGSHKRRKENFQDAPGGLRWILIDGDKIRCPVAIDPIDDPDGAIEYLIGLLPPEFQDVTCSWEFSASTQAAGDTFSAHLWFMLDRPMIDAELTAWADDVNKDAGVKLVDRSLLRTVQPHFAAAPTFEKGLHDPLPKRSGFRQGSSDVVSLPAVSALPRHQNVVYLSGGTRQTLDFGRRERPSLRGFEGHLSRMGDGDGLDGFNDPITRAIASHVWSHGAEETDSEALKAIIRSAIDAAPKGPARPSSSIAKYMSDDHLDDSIRGAREKFGAKRAERETAAMTDVATRRQRNPLARDEAEAKLAETIDGFFRDALAWTGEHAPPQVAIKAEAGIGKTEQVLGWLVRPELRGRNVVLAVPDLKLAEQIAERLDALRDADSPPVIIYRGRGAALPDGTRMCAKHEIADAVGNAGQSVMTTLCERQGDGQSIADEFCPHHPERGGHCLYMTQCTDKTPAVRIVPHAYLFLDTKGSPVRDAEILIIDEGFSRASIGALRGRSWINLDRLDAARPYFTAYATDSERDGLHRLARQVMRAFKSDNRAAALQAYGVTPGRLREAAKLERRFIDRLQITPAMDEAEQRKRASRALEREALALESFWNLLADVLESGADFSLAFRLETHAEVGGEPVTKLHMRHSADIVPPGDPSELLDRTKLSRPVLLLDASYNDRIGRRFFPRIAEPVVVDVGAPHQKIIQITDTPNSKQRLGLDLDAKRAESAKPADTRAAQRRRQELGQLIESAAAQGAVGFISHKGVVDDLRANLPPGVPSAHFGALRGRDDMGTVDRVIIAGRQLLPSQAVEDQAAAIFFRDREALKAIPPDGFGRAGLACRTGVIVGTDGSVLSFVDGVPHHPDERCAVVIDQTCIEEIGQAIARGRGVRRGAENPLEVLLLTNVPGTWPVDRVATLGELLPAPVAVMRARGIVPLSYAGIAAMYPDLFGWLAGDQTLTAEAVKKALARLPVDETRDKTHKEYLIGECPGFSRWGYRLAGARGPALEVAFDPDRFTPPDVQAALEAAHMRPVTSFVLQNQLVAVRRKGSACGIIAPEQGACMSKRAPTLAEAKSILRHAKKRADRVAPGVFDEWHAEQCRATLAESPLVRRLGEAAYRLMRIERAEHELYRRDMREAGLDGPLVPTRRGFRNYQPDYTARVAKRIEREYPCFLLAA